MKRTWWNIVSSLFQKSEATINTTNLWYTARTPKLEELECR